jgi:hypothetical protein
MRLSLLIFVGLALVLASTLSAQSVPEADTVSTLPGIEIQTAVDQAECFIGDRIEYTLTITYDSTYELIPPPLGANLGGFDVKDYQTDQITTLKDGRLQSVSTFTLSTFTTGDYVIPPIPVAFELPDDTRKVLLSEGVPIKVKSLLAEGADSLDIRPQKALFEFERDLMIWYVGGGAILLILLVAAWLVWRRLRRKEAEVEVVDTRPPWEKAFERLALLKEQNLPREGRFREYYFELTEIIRQYLGRMYDVHVLEMTTEEFIDSFRQVELPGSLYERCRDFLQHADLAKFAKYQPTLERCEEDLEAAHNMVELVRSDYVRRQTATTGAQMEGTAEGTAP